MTRTNRLLNRVVLLVVGLVLVAGGAVLVATALRPPALRGPMGAAADAVGSAWETVAAPTVALPNGPVPAAVLGAGAVAVVLAVLLIVFATTRGRGRTATVVAVEDDGGRTTADRNVAEAVVADALTARPDVLSARIRVCTVRGAPAMELDVTTRAEADLGAVVAAAERAVADWDALAGVTVPTIVHLSDRGWLDGLRSAARVS